MAYTVSQDFKNHIKDGISPQSIVAIFPDAFFRTQDFTGAITWGQYFSTSDNLRYGDAPSDTLSFSLLADGGKLSGYEFGECQTYIGVRTAVEDFASMASRNAYIEVGGKTFTAFPTGVYVDGTRFVGGTFYSLVSDGEYVWAFGSSTSLKISIDPLGYEIITPARYMIQTLKAPFSAVFDRQTNICIVWGENSKETYEYVPTGVYTVERPRKTVAEVVEIQDARDRMSRFDTDASEFVSELTFPKTLGAIYIALCEYVGVPYASATFTGSDTNYSSSPFSESAYTCRDILSWIAGKALSVAHFDRNGVLELRWLSSEAVEELQPTDIAMENYDASEYSTESVDGVLLKSSNGASLTFGGKENPYVIAGNPFISTITDLSPYTGLLTYQPMSIDVINADPSVDVGDLINTRTTTDAFQVLTNLYGEVYSEAVGDAKFRLWVKENGTALVNSETGNALGHLSQDHVALYEPIEPLLMPLMHRELVFTGICSATYEATGERYRNDSDDLSMTEYNASVAPVSQMDVFNRLTNGGLDQGIYIQDGKIYINGEYIKANSISADLIYGGTLSGASINIGNGTFRVDSNGAVTASNITITGENSKISIVPTTYQYEFLNVEYHSAQTGSYQVKLAGGALYLYWGLGMEFTQYAQYTGNEIFISNASVGNVRVRPDLITVHRVISGNLTTMLNYSPDTGSVTIRNQNGYYAVLKPDVGLKFYNSSGTEIGSYPFNKKYT